jgi:hypothetical protein
MQKIMIISLIVCKNIPWASPLVDYDSTFEIKFKNARFNKFLYFFTKWLMNWLNLKCKTSCAMRMPENLGESTIR